MRLVSLPLLVASALLLDCGAGQDLIIGEIALSGEAGSAGATSGSAGTEPISGSAAVAGSGGVDSIGGTETGGTETAGAAGTTPDGCVDGTEPPPGSLLHRYSFDGTGTTATDSIAGADGNVIGTMLDGAGAVAMDGDSRQYVELPDRIVSSLTDVTIVAWMTWGGGAAYQRVFDFGISNNGEGLGDSGRSYLAVLPMTGFEDQAKPGLGAEIKSPGLPTVTLASTEKMRDRMAQVSLVFRSGVSAALYLDGNQLASSETTITLADIDDRNNWLGQSQFQNDPEFEGVYEEFRIYNVALDSCELHTLLVRGPQTP